MNGLTDQQLLRDYADRRAEEAFTELVRRHIDFVYSAALRMARDAQLAEDVTQGVFGALARNARQLTNRTVLSGWLHLTARNLAANAVRANVRRRAREQEAAVTNQLLSGEPDAIWEHIAPHLDTALGELNEADRDALFLRYFERKSAREMADILGMSENAAQKRVSRAVERLREFFAKRGATVGAGGLVVIVSANAVQAAPVGLAAAISAAAAAAGTITTATVAAHAIMNWVNIKSIAAIVTVAFATGATIYVVQQGEINRLQNENRNLSSQVKITTSELNSANASTRQVNDEVEQLQKDKTELLRLRGEVGLLRHQMNELEVENHALRVGVSTASDQTSAEGQKLLSPEAGINGCLNNLRMIDAAMQRCALEHNLSATDVITTEQILPYLIGRKLPQCPSGGKYTFGSLTNAPTCTISGHELPSEAPIVELQFGVVMQAIMQDHNGQLSPEELTEAREAYKRDHDGQSPEGIGEFVLYLKQRGPRLRAALDAYKRDHEGQSATNALELVPYLRPVSNNRP